MEYLIAAGVFLAGFVLGASGQRTGIKKAYKAGAEYGRDITLAHVTQKLMHQHNANTLAQQQEDETTGYTPGFVTAKKD